MCFKEQGVVEDEQEPPEERDGDRPAKQPKQQEEEDRDRDAGKRRHQSKRPRPVRGVRQPDRLERHAAPIATQHRAQREQEFAVRRMDVEDPFPSAAVGVDGLAPVHFVENDHRRRGQTQQPRDGASDKQRQDGATNGRGNHPTSLSLVFASR